jgi:hypothetical protein
VNIQINDSSHKKIALAGLILALPAILLWVAAGLWTLGVRWAMYFIDASGKLPINVQLLAFAGLPVVTLVLGIIAYKRAPAKLSIAVIIIGATLVVLASIILIK